MRNVVIKRVQRSFLTQESSKELPDSTNICLTFTSKVRLRSLSLLHEACHRKALLIGSALAYFIKKAWTFNLMPEVKVKHRAFCGLEGEGEVLGATINGFVSRSIWSFYRLPSNVSLERRLCRHKSNFPRGIICREQFMVCKDAEFWRLCIWYEETAYGQANVLQRPWKAWIRSTGISENPNIKRQGSDTTEGFIERGVSIYLYNIKIPQIHVAMKFFKHGDLAADEFQDWLSRGQKYQKPESQCFRHWIIPILVWIVTKIALLSINILQMCAVP